MQINNSDLKKALPFNIYFKEAIPNHREVCSWFELVPVSANKEIKNDKKDGGLSAENAG